MSTVSIANVEPVADVGDKAEQLSPTPRPLDVLSAQDVEVDLAGHLVRVAGRPVAVPRHELRLLAALISQAGQAVPREVLMRHIWAGGSASVTSVAPGKGLEVLIGRLRRRIEPDPHRPRYVRTVRGFGYIFDRWPIGQGSIGEASGDLGGGTIDEAVRILADPLRAKIVTLLADEAMCTYHLVELTGAAQTTISHHLRILREAGWVEIDRYGRYTYYQIRPNCLKALARQTRALSDSAMVAGGRRRPC